MLKKMKSIIEIAAFIIIIAVLLGSCEKDPEKGWTMTSRALYSALGKDSTDVTLGETVALEETYDLLLAKDAPGEENTYIKLDEEGRHLLENILFAGAEIITPSEISIRHLDMMLSPKMIGWSALDDEGEVATFSAKGIALKANGEILIGDHASPGKHKIFLVLPNLPLIEKELNVKITFVNDKIREGDKKLLLQIIKVHKSLFWKNTFRIGKLAIMFIGAALVIFDLFSSTSSS